MTGRTDAGSWAAVRVLRGLASRFREAWTDLPATVRLRWLYGLGLAYGVQMVLTIGIVWAGRRADAAGLLDWDRPLLLAIVERSPVSFSSALWLQTFGTDLTLWLLAVVTAGTCAWLRRPLETLSILAAAFLLDPVVRFGWLLWPRPRPRLVADGLAAPGFASFPSGHATESLALYGLLAYLWARSSGRRLERAIAVLVACLLWCLTALGRVRMGAHWPSDVLAGAILGGAWLFGLVGVLRRAEAAPADETAREPYGAAEAVDPGGDAD